MSTRDVLPFRFCLEWPAKEQEIYYLETVAWENAGRSVDHGVLERICMGFFYDPEDDLSKSLYDAEYQGDNWESLQQELEDYGNRAQQ